MKPEDGLREAGFAGLASRPVRVVVSSEVAFDFDRVVKSLKDLMGKLGCANCFSGWDIRFDHEREFVLGEKGAIGR